MSAEDVADQALNIANAARTEVSAHERECVIRYNGITESIKELKVIIKWAGGLIVAAVLATLGWSLSNQIEQGQKQSTSLQAQMQILRNYGRPAYDAPAQ